MFNSPIIEVALGLALVYLVLSMIVTSVGEVVSQSLSIPANQLKQTLGNLLGTAAKRVADSAPSGKSILDAFYESPFIKHLAKPGSGAKKPMPANIDPAAFYPALQHAVLVTFEVSADVGDILAAAKKAKAELSVKEAELLNTPGAQAFLASDLGKSLSELTAGRIGRSIPRSPASPTRRRASSSRSRTGTRRRRTRARPCIGLTCGR